MIVFWKIPRSIAQNLFQEINNENDVKPAYSMGILSREGLKRSQFPPTKKNSTFLAKEKCRQAYHALIQDLPSE